MHYFCLWKGTSSLTDWLWQQWKIISPRCITKRHKMYINMSVYYDITGTSRICQMSVYCRCLQGSVILQPSPRNNGRGSGLAPEFSTAGCRAPRTGRWKTLAVQKGSEWRDGERRMYHNSGQQVLFRLCAALVPHVPGTAPVPPFPLCCLTPSRAALSLVSVQQNEHQSSNSPLSPPGNTSNAIHIYRASQSKSQWAEQGGASPGRAASQAELTLIPTVVHEELPAGSQHATDTPLRCFTEVSGMFIKEIKRGTSSRKARTLCVLH